MAGEMVSLDSLGLAPSKFADDNSFKELATSASWLPRLQLYGSNSGPVKEDKIGQGCFGLVRAKNQIEDLTKEVNLIVLRWRPKAMEILGEDVTSVFDPKDVEFQRIMKDSEVQDSGCMYGPEFLVWVPSVATFATFFMSSKTMRREAPNMKAMIPDGKNPQANGCVTVKSLLIKTKKYSWHGPSVTICSQPLVWPDQEELKSVIKAFDNPPVNEVEKAPEGSDRER